MKAIPTGLPDIAPISWAVEAQSTIYTVAVPIHADGTFDTGSIDVQANFAFENLRKIVESAGGTLRDVAQVVVYLTDVADAAAVSRQWEKYFASPWPNRAIIGVNALTIPGMKIEMLATVALRRV